MLDDMLDDDTYRGIADEVVHYDEAPLPPRPRYYEKYSSFTTKMDATSLHDSLQTYFEAASIDFETHQQTKAFGGVHQTRSGRECTFRVNLFDSKNDRGESEILVEFQRASGCSLAFNDLYTDVSRGIGSGITQVIPSEGEPMPSIDSSSLGIVLDAPSLKALYGLVLSPHLEQIRDGFKILAHVSKDSKNASVLLQSLNGERKRSLSEVIASALQCQDPTSNRHALILLSNLVDHPDSKALKEWLVSDYLEPLLERLTLEHSTPVAEAKDSTYTTDFTALLNRETRRRAACILKLLAADLPQDLAAIQHRLSALEQNEDDQTTKDHLQQATQAITAC